MMRRSPLPLLFALLLLALACGGDDDANNGPGTTLEGDITVFAAASLTDAFTRVRTMFEEAHPGTDVEFNFAGSSALATQITEGAPADVFASANTTQMDVVVEAGANDGDPRPFVTNVLQIAVPPGNPGAVVGLADFAREELLIGLCAEEVPCGQFGRQVLSESGIAPAVDTNEPDVRALLTKVQAGELDAGIVYRTDVAASDGSIEGVDIPEDQNVVATYPLVALGEAGAPDVAAAFVDFVLSAEGQDALQSFGFRAP